MIKQAKTTFLKVLGLSRYFYHRAAEKTCLPNDLSVTRTFRRKIFRRSKHLSARFATLKIVEGKNREKHQVLCSIFKTRARSVNLIRACLKTRLLSEILRTSVVMLACGLQVTVLP